MKIKSNEFNVLLSSAGRRVELLHIWKKTLKENHLLNSKVFACDLNLDLSPACQLADEKFNIVSCLDKNYTNYLLEKCLEKNIKLIIPTIDNELLPLAKVKDSFSEYGIEIIISNYDLIKKCNDKFETAELFKSMSIKTPKIFDKDNLKFPCFLKPKTGSSSIGIKIINSCKDLCPEDLERKDNIFQEFIDKDWCEYSLDIYYDKDSTLKCCVPRQRLEVRNGEISKGLVLKDEFYLKVLSDFKYLKGAKGPITLQIFSKAGSKVYAAIEINPRFGGGYPMSHKVGANFPSMILQEYFFKRKIPFRNEWSENKLLLRYDSTILSKN